jgi:hypothetical protein
MSYQILFVTENNNMSTGSSQDQKEIYLAFIR